MGVQLDFCYIEGEEYSSPFFVVGGSMGNYWLDRDLEEVTRDFVDRLLPNYEAIESVLKMQPLVFWAEVRGCVVRLSLRSRHFKPMPNPWVKIEAEAGTSLAKVVAKLIDIDMEAKDGLCGDLRTMRHAFDGLDTNSQEGQARMAKRAI